MKPSTVLFTLLAAVCAHSELRAQVPPLINYQGRVAVHGTNYDGTGQFKFALVNGDGSQTFWSNDSTSGGGSEPANAVSLGVVKGLYSVLLGDSAVPNMGPLPAGVFAHPDVRLRVWFDDGANGSQLLTPDQRLAPMPYLADGSVTSAVIANGAVTSTNIAPGAVNSAHVAPGSLNFSALSVPTPPGPGQVLGFDGQGLAWTAAGGGGSVFSLNGTSAFYNGGNVGLGTSHPAATLEVSSSNGNALLYATAPVPNLLFRDTQAANATSVIGGSGGGLRFYTDSFWTGANSSAFMALDNQGRLGLGTASPNHRLSVLGGTGWTSSFWLGAIELDNGGALGWRTNATAERFGLGHSDAGFYMFRTASDPGTTNHQPIYDFFLDNQGRLGIGTTEPVTKLTVAGAGAFNSPSAAAITLHNTAVGRRWEWHALDNGNFQLADFNATATRLLVDTAGNVGIGTVNPQSKLDVNGTVTAQVLTITGGADIAEPFPMKEEAIKKGSVVVIDPEQPGRLKRSTKAYDRRVAGIISGANGVNPGIALHQEGVMEGDQNVALSGRVYVEADASAVAIEPGDLLTTSETPGRAMKVIDHTRAQGAVIGKAMSSLPEGTGLVLVLVTLQ